MGNQNVKFLEDIDYVDSKPDYCWFSHLNAIGILIKKFIMEQLLRWKI